MHKQEDSKVNLKFLIEDECTKSKCFYVNQLISKVIMNAFRSITVWEKYLHVALLD